MNENHPFFINTTPSHQGFWQRMKDVFDAHYKQKFAEAEIEVGPNGDLQHFLSDVATMQLIRWKEGGFGMCAHNYDGGIYFFFFFFLFFFFFYHIYYFEFCFSFLPFLG